MQTVGGDLENGMYGEAILSVDDGRLFMMGGRDGNYRAKEHTGIYEYNDQFGFFPTNRHMKSPRYDFVAVAL